MMSLLRNKLSLRGFAEAIQSCFLRKLWIASLMLAMTAVINAYAFQADEKLADPAKEAQAQKLFQDVRCVVCEGEALADSSADMAYDMRALIRKELAAGKTPGEIRQQLVANYGQKILQSPPVEANTYLLWLFPALMLIVGSTIIIIIANGRAKTNKKTD